MPPAMRSQSLTVESAETVGIAISMQRRHLKLTQQAVAEAAGVDRVVVSQLEGARDDTAPFRVVLAVVNALEIDLELRSRHWTPKGAHPVDSQTSIAELGLTLDTLERLHAADIHEIGQLVDASDLIERPGLGEGIELYELVRVLNHRGLTLPIRRRQRVPGDRELEMFRLRIAEGLSLEAIAEQFGLKGGERVRQILNYSFGLRGTPPAAEEHRRAATAKRLADELAVAESNRVDLLARWRTGERARDLAGWLDISVACVEEAIQVAAADADREARARALRRQRSRHKGWPTA